MAYLAVLGGVRLRPPYLYGCDVWDGEVVGESHTIEGIEEKFAEINIKLYICSPFVEYRTYWRPTVDCKLFINI